MSCYPKKVKKFGSSITCETAMAEDLIFDNAFQFSIGYVAGLAASAAYLSNSYKDLGRKEKLQISSFVTVGSDLIQQYAGESLDEAIADDPGFFSGAYLGLKSGEQIYSKYNFEDEEDMDEQEWKFDVEDVGTVGLLES